MTIDKAKLKALAEAATPGPWFWDKGEDPLPHTYGIADGSDEEQMVVNQEFGIEFKEDAYFIAAANPATVLELLAEIDQLQDSSKMRAVRSLRGDVADLLAERDQLKAENEALKATLATERLSGFAAAFYQIAEAVGVTGERAATPEQVFNGEVMPAIEAMRKDARRYRWTSTEGNWVARFHGKWRAHVGEYGDAQPTDWYPSREEAIDAAMSKEAGQ
jgi:regulator of replication initiation timing